MTSQYPKKRSHSRGDTQNRILEYIKKQVAEKGYPPSVREIGEAVGLKSTSTVHGHLKRLESKGLIKRDAMKPRAMELLIDNDASTNHMVQMVPLLGPVAAGQPILAEESIRETLPIPSALLGNGTYFALAIRGDSMIQAGILNGDYVIVRQQTVANNGDIVVAMVGGDATVKRYYRENGRFRLQPENPYYDPIYSRKVSVIGKVTALFRKL